MILLAADHRGFDLKNELFKYLEQNGHNVSDIGPTEYIANDDYPDYVLQLMKKMNPQNDKAILICKNGAGISIAANKYPGIRCALVFNAEHAISSKTDDDTNAIALASHYISTQQAKEIVDAWLDAKFSQEERHIRRIEKISQILKQ